MCKYSIYHRNNFTLLHFSRSFHRVEWDSTEHRYFTSHYHSDRGDLIGAYGYVHRVFAMFRQVGAFY